jgi:hypothetical protein
VTNSNWERQDEHLLTTQTQAVNSPLLSWFVLLADWQFFNTRLAFLGSTPARRHKSESSHNGQNDPRNVPFFSVGWLLVVVWQDFDGARDFFYYHIIDYIIATPP